MADKLMFWVSRNLGRLGAFVGSKFGNASVIGGKIATQLFSGFLHEARRKMNFPIVFILGSNGKTTTTKYLVHLAEEHGEVVLTNKAGSNMTTGIAAMILSAWDEILRRKFTLGIFEVDEGFAESMARDLLPEHAVFLNVQIDQIYRLHEPERVAAMFSKTMKYVKENIVVNGNDSLLTRGIRDSGSKAKIHSFGYSGENLQNLGLYGPVPLQSETADFLVQDTNGAFTVSVNGEPHSMQTPSAGLHFALNGAAAIAAASVALSSSPALPALVSSLSSARPAFGRGEVIRSGNAQFDLILFKNRPSLQLNINANTSPSTTTVLAFDEYSQDPSWLFAIDYSSLGKVDYVSGEKADFLELALEYAGITVGERIESIRDVVQKIDNAYRDSPTPSLHRMYLDYDQMMATRSYFGLHMGVTS